MDGGWQAADSQPTDTWIKIRNQAQQQMRYFRLILQNMSKRHFYRHIINIRSSSSSKLL
jgi:hypothetical protein